MGRCTVLKNYWIRAPVAPLLSHALVLLYMLCFYHSKIMPVTEFSCRGIGIFQCCSRRCKGKEQKCAQCKAEFSFEFIAWWHIFFMSPTFLCPLLTSNCSFPWFLLYGYTTLERSPRKHKELHSLLKCRLLHGNLIVVFLFSPRRTWSGTLCSLWQIFNRLLWLRKCALFLFCLGVLQSFTATENQIHQVLG